MELSRENTYFAIVLFLTYLKFCQTTKNFTDNFTSDDDIFYQVFGDVRLRKCHCKADEVFRNSECITAETFVPVLLYPGSTEAIYVNTSLLHVLENSGMQCGYDKFVAAVHPRDLFILITGELYQNQTNKKLSPIEYCVEHILDKDKVAWEVQICLPTHEIPTCCPQPANELVSFCSVQKMPVWYGLSPVKNPMLKTIKSEPIKCNANETQLKIAVKDPSISPSSFTYYSTASSQLVVYSKQIQKLLNKDHYCIQPKKTRRGISYEVSFCVLDPVIEHEQFCQNSSCVRKCCQEGELYSYQVNSCISSQSDHWTPKFKGVNDSAVINLPQNLKITYGFPLCRRLFYRLSPTAGAKDAFELLANGQMYVYKGNFFVSAPRYCMDKFLNKENETVLEALTCFPDTVIPEPLCERVKTYVVPILLVISCFFLFITVIVYVSIPELHTKLHGKSLLSHVTALFVAYLFLAMVQWIIKRISMTTCRAFAFVIQISFLGAIFWLNVMCFDIWWTLRSMRPIAEPSENFRRRFFYYSVYAWGCPLVIGIVTCIMESLPDTPENSHLVLPGFGQNKCWFRDNASLWAYFYSFVSILTVANISFFIGVAVILIRAQRANNSILRTANKQHKERVWIYLKLFIVMGITWICEVASWQEGSCEYWLVTDAINSLQGFFIFLIFICKRNIFTKIHSRGTASTRKLKRMVTGSSSYGSSTQVTQQTSLDSTRKLSTSIQYHLSRLNRDKNLPENEAKK